MILDDQRIKVREIAETIGISKKKHVGYILYDELNTKKLCTRWVPRLLTDQNRTRMKISEQCLERFNKNKTDFVHRSIIMDETWIHHYTPES
jgi:hypothetical protein